MSVNKYHPHLLVIPEDDANRQLIEGFRNHLSVDSRKVHVENPAGGWGKVLAVFRDEHITRMQQYPERYVLLLIDFDNVEGRLAKAKAFVPPDLDERVFILGSWSDPEKLSAALGLKKEELGTKLAAECVDEDSELWKSQLLAHNHSELCRMKESICGQLLAD